MMRLPVTFQVQLPVEVTRDGRWFISRTPVLDVCSQGDTEVSAIANLTEAIQLFLLSCFERGTLGTVLRESGFRRADHPSPETESPISRSITVPLPFLVERQTDPRCPA